MVPHRIETPRPIAKKILTVDYVRETIPYAKFRANPRASEKNEIRRRAVRCRKRGDVYGESEPSRLPRRS